MTNHHFTHMVGVAPEALPAIFWLNRLGPNSVRSKVSLGSRNFHKKNSKFLGSEGKKFFFFKIDFNDFDKFLAVKFY
jgi:hypothetical protein